MSAAPIRPTTASTSARSKRRVNLGSAQDIENFDYRTYGKPGVDDVGDIDLEDSHADLGHAGEAIEMQDLSEPLLRLSGRGGRTIESRTLTRGKIRALDPVVRRELSTAIGGAEITVSTGGKLFARFGKALGKNAVALAAMVALGYALPKEAGPYISTRGRSRT